MMGMWDAEQVNGNEQEMTSSDARPCTDQGLNDVSGATV